MGRDSILWNNYGKWLILLVAIILLLQSYQMFYSIRHQQFLKAQPLSAMMNATNQQQIKMLIQNLKIISDKMKDVHIMDTSGTYLIVPNLVKGKLDTKNLDGVSLTICTQTTINNLYNLIDLVNVWKGPVSVTVFAHGENVISAVYAVAFYSVCYENIAKQVSFHIVYPVDPVPQGWQKLMTLQHHDCGNDRFIRNSSHLNYADTKVPYPHNVLRNIAISFSESPYILMTDIDLIPSMDLQADFHKFVVRKGKTLEKSKLVFVTPVFESKLDKIFSNKSILLNDWVVDLVRPFYETVCFRCQSPTDYEEWRRLAQVGFLDVGYVLDYEDTWEPFYIAKKDGLPLYDDRFKQYGFNRISQVCFKRSVFERF